jgi:4-hydroxy-tetrahydrodipicolinate reductase
MRAASERVAVFFSRNMSLGINLLISLCRRAAATLGADFDIEIIEKHHNKKLDAPSGTALMIADALSEDAEHAYVYDRHAERRARAKGEIGLHAVRGGTIVGEHEVLFCGKDEVVTLSHSAASREVFATGAIRAARFMKGKATGFYNMDDVIGNL